jgi:copper chaperone CopZ
VDDTTTFTFTVTGLSEDTAPRVVTILEQQPGVHRANASVKLGRIAVDVDRSHADTDRLIQALRWAGHQAVIDPF